MKHLIKDPILIFKELKQELISLIFKKELKLNQMKLKFQIKIDLNSSNETYV